MAKNVIPKNPADKLPKRQHKVLGSTGDRGQKPTKQYSQEPAAASDKKADKPLMQPSAAIIIHISPTVPNKPGNLPGVGGQGPSGYAPKPHGFGHDAINRLGRHTRLSGHPQAHRIGAKKPIKPQK